VRDLIERRASAKVALVRGSGGVFEITIDGTLGYSKKSTGRFPQDRELAALFPASE
jgi:selT/selW/selH-like putative selenoprotein